MLSCTRVSKLRNPYTSWCTAGPRDPKQQLGLASPGKSRQVQASLGTSVGANNPILEWDTLGHYGTPAERRLQEIIKPCGRCIKP